FTAEAGPTDFLSEVRSFLSPKIQAALRVKEKLDRYAAFDQAKIEAEEKVLAGKEGEDKEIHAKYLGKAVEDLKYELSRKMILDDQVRIDGRDTKTVRPIKCEVALLPRAHGSGLFTRGETQVLGAVTLGTGDDEQRVDALQGLITRSFMLHYNFPPYCVGEVGRLGGQSRREIGHGFLAERALQA